MSNRDGALPLYLACANNTVATVEYLYKLYPDAINHATIQGWYPIHIAIAGLNHRDSPIAAAEIVQFLLGCDPHVKLQKFQGMSLLHYACRRDYNDSKIETGSKSSRLIMMPILKQLKTIALRPIFIAIINKCNH